MVPRHTGLGYKLAFCLLKPPTRLSWPRSPDKATLTLPNSQFSLKKAFASCPVWENTESPQLF
jgi:hypothetical protein